MWIVCTVLSMNSKGIAAIWIACTVPSLDKGIGCYMDCLHCPVNEQQGYSCYMDCLYCPVTEQQGHTLLYGLLALSRH